MIKKIGDVFKLDTKNTTYLLRISDLKHVLSEYYGASLGEIKDFSFSKEKYSTPFGTSTVYDEDKDPNYSLDSYSFELSTFGKGDYKEPSIIIKNEGGFTSDFRYFDYKINKELTKLKTLPTPHNFDEELILILKDEEGSCDIELTYGVDFENDVIVRNTKVIAKNNCNLLKIMSFQLDIVNRNFDFFSLYGGWGFEGQKERVNIGHGSYYIDSKTGNSSNRHNPFFMILEHKADFNNGDAYGFNLIYSGNHYEFLERSSFNKLRIMGGINPFNFDYPLRKGDVFESPFEVLTFSNKGINGVSHNMHNFVREKVLPLKDIKKNPPILVNNWEATYMKFKQGDLHSIINKAKEFGLEMFVLDDGWFGRREDDTKGLGDYDVNKKKLHSGLDGLAKYTNKKGLEFGLWFEPEMVNENSKLYETHPDWVIIDKNRKPSKGRHQLVLNLAMKEVQDYIVDSIDSVLKSANIKYIKWDMNRHISDVSNLNFNSGAMYHEYIKGLYSVMNRITDLHKDVYFEGCASGGNRFDLGILSYFNQIWTSDDTDAYERISIQSGYALAYPLRTLSNHVSASPSHQLLRKTPFSTRFNVAFFGAFGYEIDLSLLKGQEKKDAVEQVEFYKAHRDIVINGDFYQLKDINEDGYSLWLCVSKDKKEAILGYFNGLQKMNPTIDEIKLVGLEEDATYEFKVKKEDHNIHMFGGLINMIMPFRVDPDGKLVNFISKIKRMDGENESYEVSGKALMSGALKLDQQWMGTGLNEDVRVLGDFGSRLYYIKEK